MGFHELENGPVAEFILFVCLNGVCSLVAQRPHCTLYVHRPLLSELIDTVVDDTERSASADTCTAVDDDLVIARRGGRFG